MCFGFMLEYLQFDLVYESRKRKHPKIKYTTGGLATKLTWRVDECWQISVGKYMPEWEYHKLWSLW